MKSIGLLFFIAFIFFSIAQILWTFALIIEDPLFGSFLVEDWIMNISYSLCSIFGVIASLKLYSNK